MLTLRVLHQGRTGRDLDGLGHLTHLKCNIDRRAGADLQGTRL